MKQNQNSGVYCAPSRWEKVAREEAMAGALNPVHLLSGKRTRPYVHARWRAWQRLIDLGHSFKSVGTASGFHHTTVMHGVKPEQRERNRAERVRKSGLVNKAPVSGYPICLASTEIGVIGNRHSHKEAI